MASLQGFVNVGKLEEVIQSLLTRMVRGGDGEVQ